MRIRQLSTTQFRNLRHEPLEFAPDVNLLIGENGQGKTNVLEAIYLFKFGRSFRTARDTEMIHFGEAFCRVEVACDYASDDRERLAAAIEKDGTKTIKMNGKEVPKLSDLVGRYPIVIFGPSDLEIVSGYPAERRRFIDMVGSMTSRTYLDTLRAYRRVLGQRNAAFKSGRARDAQGVWTEELIRHGCALVDQRTALVEALRDELEAQAAAVETRHAVTMAYESELTKNRPEEVSCEEQFAARLAAVDGEERRRRTTLVGPHRDDLLLTFDGRDLRKYGSQGQRRLVAILLKLVELGYTEKQLREPCVLLLDDLLSELDDDISAKLKRYLDGSRQIFVTSPHELEWSGGSPAIWRVSGGSVERSSA